VSRYPLFDPEFLDALERQLIQPWHGIAWRVTVGATEPLLTNTRGARWNPRGVEVLYTSLHRDAAIAEVEHLLSQQPVPVRAKRVVSQLRVQLSKVVDLSKPEFIEALGYSIDDVTRDGWVLTQKIGSAAEFLEATGLLVPSARADATNLVILMKNQSANDLVDVVGTTSFEPHP
jgi:RES domain-containing protein